MRAGSPALLVWPEIHWRSGRREGLGGLVLDDGEESLLAAIGGGEVELVEGEEAGGDEDGDDEDGSDDAVEADAAGLHRGELGGAIERAEGDENGDQSAERSDVVEDEGDEVDEVLADGDERRAVAEDGADEFEEGEDEEEGGEGEEDDGEVGGVLAHDVVVEQKRELDAGDAAEAAEKRGDVVVGAHVGRFELPLMRRVTSLLRPTPMEEKMLRAMPPRDI